MSHRICIFAALLWSAIASAENAVQELAITTGTNLALISGKLAEHQKGVNEVTARRIDVIASLERLAAERRLLVDRELTILQQTDGGDLVKLLDGARTLGDKAAASPAAVDAVQARAKIELTGGYTPLAISTDKLDQAAKALAALAKTSSNEAYLKYLVAYFKDVRASIDKLKQESASSKQKADQAMAAVQTETARRDQKAQDFMNTQLEGAAHAAIE